MPSAINIDRSPRAPGQTLTPYEMAANFGLLDVWLVCHHTGSTYRPAPGPCKHGDAGQYRARQSADIVPHNYEDADGGCRHCPLPANHRAHRVATVDPDVIDADLRRAGEREESAA